MNDIQVKSSKALKWSSLAEIIAKLVTPISNLILARLLTPEAFGVVATVTMVISFADMFSDSGFQKFLVQHEFDNDEDLRISANVAFSSNIILSLCLWGLLCLCNDRIASLVGNPGLGVVIIVAGISLPATSFSSIQAALFRRKFNFKVLFYSRVVSAVIPLIVTVPLALLGLSYWALIIGTIIGNFSTAIILTVLSPWKPKLIFRKKEFLEMLSFSVWSLFESLGTWLSSYIGTFIVSSILSQYYVGLYKTTMTTVNGLFAIITTATTSVLFTSLSRLQSDKQEYDKYFVDFIRIVSILIIPIGFGTMVYKDLVTQILLGSQWTEAVPFVGIYGLMSCLTLILGQYSSEYFRGLGKPKANVLMTVLHLAALIPILIISANHGFIVLAYARSFVKAEQILVFWGILWFGFKFNPIRIIKCIAKPVLSAIVMSIIGYAMLGFCTSYFMQFISVLICIIVYFGFYAIVLRGKKDVLNLVRMFTGRGEKNE